MSELTSTQDSATFALFGRSDRRTSSPYFARPSAPSAFVLLATGLANWALHTDENLASLVFRGLTLLRWTDAENTGAR
jgi:hypothetical protein